MKSKDLYAEHGKRCQFCDAQFTFTIGNPDHRIRLSNSVNATIARLDFRESANHKTIAHIEIECGSCHQTNVFDESMEG